MIPQPSDALPNYVYFMTLVREDDLQFRIGECVYVLREGEQPGGCGKQKEDNEEGVGREGETEEQAVGESTPGAPQGRENWDIFQVERLYKNERLVHQSKALGTVG